MNKHSSKKDAMDALQGPSAYGNGNENNYLELPRKVQIEINRNSGTQT